MSFVQPMRSFKTDAHIVVLGESKKKKKNEEEPNTFPSEFVSVAHQH